MTEEVVKGYEVVEKNLKLGEEGLLIGVKKGTFIRIEEITDSEMKNLLTVRITYPNITIRLILLHAPQENEILEAREDFFEEVANQIERGVTSGEKFIVVGDFNARIGEDEVISPSGKLMKELIDEYHLRVCNFDKLTEGKWTRIQARKDGSICKSVLDYIMLEEDMYPMLVQLIIDEEKIYCPYHEKKEKGKKRIIFSDHCPMILKLKIELGKFSPKPQSRKVWNFTEEGYNCYERESKTFLTTSKGESVTERYEEWVVNFEKLLHKCFTKKTIKAKANSVEKSHKNIREIMRKIARKGKIQRSIIKSYLKRLIEFESKQQAIVRMRKLKKTMSQLSIADKFSPNGYWRMKKAAGKGRPINVSTIVKESGVIIKGESAIIQAYKEEFEFRLRTRVPERGWEDYVVETNEIIRKWLNADCESSPPFLMQELEKVVNKQKKGSAPGIDGYPGDLFIRAGGGVLDSILQLFNIIKERREIPDQWNCMKIVTIYKCKGSQKELKYYRGIFLALVISKIFEGLVKLRIDGKLERVNVLQAGSRKNRSCADNVFLLRGCIDHHIFTKRPLYITAYDYEQAFDSLWVEDCILAMRNIGISQEMSQLIYKLNKSAKVIVDTPHGPTTAFLTEPIVKQGTVLGSLLCSTSTGEYCGRNLGVMIGTLIIATLLYVDDIIDLSGSRPESIKSHQNALTFSRSKKLGMSGTKCYNMIINKSEGEEPLELAIDEVKKVMPATIIVYLGDVFNEKGNNEDLVKDRRKRGTKAMISIMALVAETDVGLYKVPVCLLLYRSLFVSTVLFNAQTWSKLTVTNLDPLKRMQSKMLKRIVGVSYSTCTAFTFLELGVIPLEYEIHQRKLIYLHRILALPENDPVYLMFVNMMALHECGEKNWCSDISFLMERYEMRMGLDQLRALTKETFKGILKKNVKDKVFKELVTECRSMKKTKAIQYTSFKVQDYLTNFFPEQSRIIFQARSRTLNLKTHQTHKYSDDVCRGCREEKETLEHIINCKGTNKLHTTKEEIKFNFDDMEELDETQRMIALQCVYRVKAFLDTNT